MRLSTVLWRTPRPWVCDCSQPASAFPHTLSDIMVLSLRAGQVSARPCCQALSDPSQTHAIPDFQDEGTSSMDGLVVFQTGGAHANLHRLRIVGAAGCQWLQLQHVCMSSFTSTDNVLLENNNLDLLFHAEQPVVRCIGREIGRAHV